MYILDFPDSNVDVTPRPSSAMSSSRLKTSDLGQALKQFSLSTAQSRESLRTSRQDVAGKPPSKYTLSSNKCLLFRVNGKNILVLIYLHSMVSTIQGIPKNGVKIF